MSNNKLPHRFTVRVSKPLYDNVCKVALEHDLDYAQLIRQAISSYLTNIPTMTANSNNPMSANKTTVSPVDKVDSNSPVAPSLYGWD